MRITIGKKGLIELVALQLRGNFLCSTQEYELLESCICEVIGVVETCLRANINKYFWDENGRLVFDPYHSGQYTIFLYFLSRLVWKKHGDKTLASKVYYLNKMFNSCDLYYEVDLPSIFFLDHPVGSVIGRGSFSDYLVFQQNCTVGGNNEGVFPTFGEFVWLYTNAVVIGASTIGNNVFVSAGTYIKDTDIPDNTIVFGRSPNLTLKHKPSEYFCANSPFQVHK